MKSFLLDVLRVGQRAGSAASPDRLLLLIAGIGALAFQSGCAVTPDVVIKYKPIEWQVGVAVTHTISCEGSQYWIESGVAVVPNYQAGEFRDDFVIRSRSFNSPLADSDMTVSLTEDGRLKSINNSSSGQGDVALRALITAAATVGATGASGQFRALRVQPQDETICDVVKRYGRSEQTEFHQLSIALIGIGNWNNRKGDLAPSAHQRPAAEQLRRFFNLDCTFELEILGASLHPVQYLDEAANDRYIDINIQDVRPLQVAIRSRPSAMNVVDPALNRTATIPVPMKAGEPGSITKLRIPQAAIFGRQSFSADFTESGRITRIGYGRSVGVAGALGAVAAVASAETTLNGTEAATLRAAADLIAQQKRLAACLINRADCN